MERPPKPAQYKTVAVTRVGSGSAAGIVGECGVLRYSLSTAGNEAFADNVSSGDRSHTF